jgi:hypothetical protein
VPVLTPHLSSLWIHIVTPVSHRIARPLALGLKNRVVCRNDDAVRLMPHRRLTAREAIEAALGQVRDHQVESTWADAGPIPGDPDWAGGTIFEDRRSVRVEASPDRLFRVVCRIGGEQGWFAADPLWKIRGAIDRLIGGPGLSRGRRHPDELSYGDVLDFWRVSGIEPKKRLVLRAEMKLPGEALLEFVVEPERRGGACTDSANVDRSVKARPAVVHLPGARSSADGDGGMGAGACREGQDPSVADRLTGERAVLTQIARFRPRGLLGLVYWYAVLPFHGFVFRSMLHAIRRRAEAP